MEKKNTSRRQFMTKVGRFGTAALTLPHIVNAGCSATGSLPITRTKNKAVGPNGKLQIALIGAGGMGTADARTAISQRGVKLRAVCDLYTSRLKEAKENFGSNIEVTRDYREILERKDIDAVIVATHDHWHQQISVEALEKGLHVYCEKPMVHSIGEGPAVIEAQKKSGKVYMVGSQLLSSLGYEKSKELLKEGAIGKLNYAEGVWARRSSEGAWNGKIPDDASEKTVDWDTFLKDKKRYEFDPERFFRWRKYVDYGTGMNGDLFVHIISGLHFVTDSLGPEKIYSTGGIRHWQDGREVPDVLIGTFDYPETKQHPGFNLSLRCNFVDGSKGSFFYVMRLIGSEGYMEIQPNRVVLGRNKVMSGIDPNVVRDELKKVTTERKKMLGPEESIYEAEPGYEGCHYDHFGYFFDAIRNGTDVVEDAIFGFRASAPALSCHQSYFSKSAVLWDPVEMRVVK